MHNIIIIEECNIIRYILVAEVLAQNFPANCKQSKRWAMAAKNLARDKIVNSNQPIHVAVPMMTQIHG